MTTFTGAAGVTTYQALVIRKALELYVKTGIRVNRAYTPTAMLNTASKITGKQFKRGEYQKAISELTIWLEANGRAA
jgi:hypothetical protein